MMVAHVNDLVDIYRRRNLVTKRRAPLSIREGTMRFGLFKRVKLFPKTLCAAIIPACNVPLCVTKLQPNYSNLK